MRLRPTKKTNIGRRRILSESSRPQAFSYHANRAEQESNLGRQQPREQDVRKHDQLARYWRQRIGILVAGVAIIICILDILHLSSTPKVIALTASSNNYFLQPTDVYQKAAAKLFASSLFNANKITINSDQIKQKLEAEFPELSDVSVTLPLIGHRPIVYIAPTTPSLILVSLHNGTYVLDNNGKALLQANRVAGLSGLSLPTVTDESGVVIKPNQVALSSSSVSFIKTVVQELNAKNTSVQSLKLPTAADELDVYPNGVGYYVKFNMHSNNALQQVGTFLAVQQRLCSQNITPGSYIDVRVNGRAYYK